MLAHFLILFASLSSVVLANYALDYRSLPKGARKEPCVADVEFARAFVAFWLWLLWLGLAGRAGFAAVASIITLAVFCFISRMKYGYLREPLVFSDIGFIATLIRHPDLFYLGRKEGGILMAVVLALLGVIVVWTSIEPRIIGQYGQIAVLAASLATIAAFFWLPRVLIALVPETIAALKSGSARDCVARCGLSVSLAWSLAGWRAEGISQQPNTVDPKNWDAVVVIQAESFIDMRRSGIAIDLPNLDRARARATTYGRLSVSGFGAYTHRSEAEMLTGIAFADQGFDRFNPYLRPQLLQEPSLATELREKGWRTRYIHPHDRRFFRRDLAIPLLGFDEFIDDTAFSDADRYGLYVSDDAVAERIIGEIGDAALAGQPLFLMAVTMEAHDPYGVGRLAETDDPVEQYMRHIANADAMLGKLITALDEKTERSLLVFYGDHAPLLPGHERLADDPATDFVLLRCGLNERPAGDATLAAMSPAMVNAELRGLLEADLPPSLRR